MHAKPPTLKVLTLPAAVIALAAAVPMVLAGEGMGSVYASRSAATTPADRAGAIVKCVNEAARQFCKPRVVWAESAITDFAADEGEPFPTLSLAEGPRGFSFFMSPALIALPPPVL